MAKTSMSGGRAQGKLFACMNMCAHLPYPEESGKSIVQAAILTQDMG